MANASATNGQPAVSFASTFKGGEGSPSYPAGGAENCWDQTPESGSCQQQKDWGKCSESWLKDGGYCKATCSLCGEVAAPSSSEAGGCSDVAPPDGTSCQQQKDWGKVHWGLCGEMQGPVRYFPCLPDGMENTLSGTSSDTRPAANPRPFSLRSSLHSTVR